MLYTTFRDGTGELARLLNSSLMHRLEQLKYATYLDNHRADVRA